MHLSLFVFFRVDNDPNRRVTVAELRALEGVVANTPNLAEALIYTPQALGDQPYSGDGPPPSLALQLDFRDLTAMEAAIGPRGYLQRLIDSELIPSLSGATVEHQAMLKRPFRVMEPEMSRACTFLVAYPGRAADFPAWLSHYLSSHCPIMLRFPRIRGLEVYTRMDWCSGMPWKRADAMQRNKVVFDNVDDLQSSLASPVLDELREDVRRGPPAEGGSVHYPMATVRVWPG